MSYEMTPEDVKSACDEAVRKTMEKVRTEVSSLTVETMDGRQAILLEDLDQILHDVGRS